MAGLTEGLKIAFAAYVEGALSNPAAAARLKEKAFPLETRVKELRDSRGAYEKDEAKYRDLVAQKRAASEQANKSLDGYYNKASGLVDQIAGTLGKDDATVKEMRNWRDRMATESARGAKQGPAGTA